MVELIKKHFSQTCLQVGRDAENTKKEMNMKKEKRKIEEQTMNIAEKSNSGFIPLSETGGKDEKEGKAKQDATSAKGGKTISAEEELHLKYDELNDKHLRLYSDFENFKKRTIKERIELFKSAGEDIVTALLPILDDFDRVANHESDDIKILKEAVKLIHNKFKNIFVQKGLEDMDSMNKKFDTDMHEAITNIPAPSKKLKGKVIDVVEKGYLLNGKVIRYAKVVVGN